MPLVAPPPERMARAHGARPPDAPRPRGGGGAPAARWRSRPLLLSLALHGALGAFAVHEAYRELRVGPAAALPCLHAVCPQERAPEMDQAALELEGQPELLPVSEPEQPAPPEHPPEVPAPEDLELLEPLEDGPQDARVPEIPSAPSWAALTSRRVTPKPGAAARPAPPAPAAEVRPAPTPSAPPAAPAPTGAVQRRRTPHVPRTAALARLSPPLTVNLLLTLEANGRVSEVSVERSSGAEVFDAAARSWVLAQWSFEPLGRRVRIRVPVHLRG